MLALSATCLVACAPPAIPPAAAPATDAGPYVAPTPAPAEDAASATPAAGSDPARPTPDAPPPKAASEPLAGPSPAALDVRGFGAAVVVLPLGATKKRPVLIAAHGNYDRPEWQCQVWGEVVRGRAFVLCPRGVPRRDSPSPSDPRFEYASNEALEREVDAGVEALRARHPEHVDDGPLLWAGFSLGAIQGAVIAVRKPARYPRLALVEGGHESWTRARAAAFAKGGGTRVLFACAQAGCTAAARAALPALAKAGVAAREVHGQRHEGHTYVGEVSDAFTAAFGWLVEGDPRFAGAD